MTKDKLKQFFGYMRAVQLNELINTKYNDKAEYLKSSELTKRLVEVEAYITSLIKENEELSVRLSNQKAQSESMKSEIRRLEEERSLLVERVAEAR